MKNDKESSHSVSALDFFLFVLLFFLYALFHLDRLLKAAWVTFSYLCKLSLLQYKKDS